LNNDLTPAPFPGWRGVRGEINIFAMKKHTILSILVMVAIFAQSQPFMKLDASFYSPSLDMVKKVDIYLPGEYFVNFDFDFPVIYYLHGGGGNENSGSTRAMTYYGNHYGDSTITSPAAIFVCPDGSCEPYLGSMWLNSDLYGNYEDFVIHDLIEFIESNFRVIPDRNFRFIHGQSMGGFGSAFLSCKHPELFRACCPTAGAFSFPDTLIYNWRDAVYEENDGFHLSYGAGTRTDLLFTVCGGYAPNMQVEPWHFECIYDTSGNVVDSVYEKWQQFNSCKMIKDLTPMSNISFFLICGVEDEFIFYPSNLEFIDSLQKYGMDYRYAWNNYGHTVYDPVTHTVMFEWLDSLIAVSYLHLGMEEEFNIKNSELRIELYPNPASDVVHIQYFSEFLAPSDFTVCNHLGQVVMQIREGWKPAGLHKRSIDITGLPAGMYFLRLSSGGKAGIVKLIKQ
jgi:enterochelin esterase-like enzyme